MDKPNMRLLLQYANLHNELVNLCNSGLEDTQDADNVRDCIDSVWFQLRRKELDVLKLYSEFRDTITLKEFLGKME